MWRHLESGLVGVIALACVAFAAVLVRGPARGEERTMQDVWREWRSWWNGGQGDVRVLGRDQVVRVPRWREGCRVRVEAGTVIVTREGDRDDHVLEAGAELRLPGRGLVVAWALEPSRVEIRRGGEERPAERPAASRPLSLAR